MDLQYSKPIPILRTFESKGKKYVYGYACIFDSPDYYGTVITKEVVEQSLPHLHKFPALRLMHKIPFGQILFNQEVEGIKTYLDSHGFHVIAQIYNKFQDEWQMINNGGWGFSYGFMPAREGGTKTIRLSEGKYYEAFVKGTLYEISVVDTPAHSEAIVHTIERMLTDKRQQIICTKSCEYYFSCANFNPNEPCLSFQLKPNHELKRDIDTYDRISLTRYVSMIHQTQSPSIKRELSKVVNRYLKPEEKLRTMIGFDQFEINEDGSLSVIPEPQYEKSKVPDPEPECMRMLRLNDQKRREKEK